MADKWAVATGNWSNPATWDGGTLPQAGDDVFADGFTVTINQNVTVLSIRTTQRSGGTAGGGFTLNTGFNVTGNIVCGSTVCLSISTASGTHTVTGNVTGGTVGGSNGAINKSGNSSLVVVGNVTGGSSGGSVGVNITGGGSVTITGNCTGTSVGSCHGVRYAGGSSLAINGNVTGGSANTTCGVQVNASPMNVTITGTVDNGSGYQSSGLNIGSSTTGTVIINGNVVTTNGQPTVQLSELNSNISLTVNGNVTAAAGNAIASISSGGSVAASNTATITVNGNVTSSGPLAAIVHLTNNGFVIVNGSIFSHTTGNVPIAAYRILLHPSTTMQHEYRVNNAGSPGVARSLYTGGVNLNQPAVSNVRSGIVYGAANEFTGTCAVPGAASVAVGVPVDNTVGTAAITAASIRAAVGLASANLDTQLAGLASDIDNITVDNTAIASEVRTNLGLTGSLDSAFDAIPTAAENGAAGWNRMLVDHTSTGSFGWVVGLFFQLIENVTGWRFTAKALEQVSGPDVYVYPMSMDQEPRNTHVTITVYTEETGSQYFFAYDSAGAALDLTGKTLEFRVADTKSKQRLYTAKTSDGTLTISLGNKVTFTKSTKFTRFANTDVTYSLRDMDAGGEVLLDGQIELVWAP